MNPSFGTSTSATPLSLSGSDTGDLDKASEIIKSSQVFLTQLEAPINTVLYALKIAKENNVVTVFNPAPAISFNHEAYEFIDYFTPNEIEASFYIDDDKIVMESGATALDDTDEQSFILLDGTDSSSRDLGGFLTVTNGAGMAADLTLTADADASFTVS